MKKLVSAIVALGLAVAFTAPTLAADVTTAKTKAECHKAGGMWDATAKACKAKDKPLCKPEPRPLAGASFLFGATA